MIVPRCAAETGKQKKAAVQWFARVSEVPPKKLKLLGREPHPQEIFFYEGRGCDDEVDAESILRPVLVRTYYPQSSWMKSIMWWLWS